MWKGETGLIRAGMGLAGCSKGMGIFGCQERKVNIFLCFLLVLIYSTGQIFGIPEFQCSGLFVSAAATSSSPSCELVTLGRITGMIFLMSLVPILHLGISLQILPLHYLSNSKNRSLLKGKWTHAPHPYLNTLTWSSKLPEYQPAAGWYSKQWQLCTPLLLLRKSHKGLRLH